MSRNIKIKIYRTIIFPVVSIGSKSLFLTLREEHRARIFQHSMQRRVFESKDQWWGK
jgi:hypothetical protein